MKDGDFDRLRIPLDGSGGVEADDETDDEIEGAYAQRLGIAASPAQLAAGSAILAGLILVGIAALRRRARASSDPESD